MPFSRRQSRKCTPSQSTCKPKNIKPIGPTRLTPSDPVRPRPTPSDPSDPSDLSDPVPVPFFTISYLKACDMPFHSQT